MASVLVHTGCRPEGGLRQQGAMEGAGEGTEVGTGAECQRVEESALGASQGVTGRHSR